MLNTIVFYIFLFFSLFLFARYATKFIKGKHSFLLIMLAIFAIVSSVDVFGHILGVNLSVGQNVIKVAISLSGMFLGRVFSVEDDSDLDLSTNQDNDVEIPLSLHRKHEEQMGLSGLGKSTFNPQHIGDSLDGFLEEDGLLVGAEAEAKKRVGLYQNE